jgi:hypothetical protein
MKEQYVGDINDYRKYALLRALAGGGKIKIGVCWMLTPRDNRSDGNKLNYLKNPNKWRRYDPSLFDFRRVVAAQVPRTCCGNCDTSTARHNYLKLVLETRVSKLKA